MTKIVLNNFELSDIKKVVEEVLEKQLKGIQIPKKKELKLLTRKDTAKFLCISLPTLHEWTKTGVVVAHRIGNRVLYKQDDVHQALSQIRTNRTKGGLLC